MLRWLWVEPYQKERRIESTFFFVWVGPSYNLDYFKSKNAVLSFILS